MLPEALFSTYEQYKRDTAAVTTWLATTASSLGYKPSPVDVPEPPVMTLSPATSGRLKGKARAEAKKKAAAAPAVSSSVSAASIKPLVKTRDLIPMAKLVAEHKTKVPSFIATSLNAAIMRRANFAAKLLKHGSTVDDTSRDSHDYFLTTLVQIRNHLRPHVQVTATSQDNPSPFTSNTTSALANRFEGLVVSEPTQAFLDASDIVVTSSPAPVSPPRQDRAETLKQIFQNCNSWSEKCDAARAHSASYPELDQDVIQEADFAFSLLIHDLCSVRDYLKSVWSRVKAEDCDFMQAAITTDAAIDLIKSMVNDIMPLVEKNGGMNRMVRKNYLMELYWSGIDMRSFFEPVGGLSGKIVLDEASHEVADRTLFLAWENLFIFTRVYDGNPEHIPIYNDALLGEYDPTLTYDDMDFNEKDASDRKLFRPLMADLMVVTRACPGWPARDALLSAMKTMDTTWEPLLHAAFAVQIYLDIAHTMGRDISKGYDTLMRHATEIEKDIRTNLRYHEKHNLPFLNPKTQDNSEVILNAIHLLRIDQVCLTTRVLKRDLKIALSTNDLEPNRMLRHSPLLSGLMLFVLRSWYRELSFNVANKNCSIVAAQHLYQAISIRKEGQIQAWPDMDLVHKIMRPRAFYPSQTLPKDLVQCCKLIYLQLGVPVSIFARDSRSRPEAYSKTVPRAVEPPAAILSIFEKKYTDTNPQFATLDADIVEKMIFQSRYEVLRLDRVPDTRQKGDYMMRQIEDEDLLREKGRQAAAYFGAKGSSTKIKIHSSSNMKAQVNAYSLNIAPDDLFYEPVPTLLHQLHLHMEAELVEFGFPFLRMHRECCDMIHLVQEKCNASLDSVLPMAQPARGRRGRQARMEKLTRNGTMTVMDILVAATTMHDYGVPIPEPLDLAGEAVEGWLVGGGGQKIRDKHLPKLALDMLNGLAAPGWKEGKGKENKK